MRGLRLWPNRFGCAVLLKLLGALMDAVMADRYGFELSKATGLAAGRAHS